MIHMIKYMQRWARVPGFLFLRSRVPGILGTRARGNSNFIQDRGNAESKSIGKLNLRFCAEMTGAPLSPYTRETGLSVSSGQVWPGRFNHGGIYGAAQRGEID